nr:J381 [uncultured bacterium]
MHDKIAFVKTGWSDEYQGGPVLGRYAHIAKFGEAHERFNFRRTADERFYGYLPPIGRAQRPPQPAVEDGWLLIFVSARKGTGPLTVVGWYEEATLHSEYSDRPEYVTEPDFEKDAHGAKYGYCISADAAHLIPVASRRQTVSGDHFKRSPILYARGNGKNEPWRRELASLAEELVSSPPPDIGGPPPRFVFPDPEHRKKVELAAVEAALHFLRKNYKVTDRQKDNCGYDLLARHKKTDEELHVEVKGTSGEAMHFYMTRGEYRYMLIPQWRLLIVTNTLVSPKLSLLTRAEVEKTFDLEAFAWEAVAK